MPDLLAPLAQFGAAGLIGWMWLTERRATATRERQLTEAHDRLVGERERVEALVGLIAETTRGLTRLEDAQRQLASVVERLADVLAADRALAPRAAG